MRNLQVNRIKRTPLPTHFGKINGFYFHCDADSKDTSTVYCVRDGELWMLRADNDQNETLLIPKLFGNVITELDYMTYEGRICFATEDAVVFYCCDGGGTLDVGLEKTAFSLAWNPTRDVLAVVYEDGEVATYGVDFEDRRLRHLYSSTLDDAVPCSVYVGWGSAETQFRGSEGKFRKRTAEVAPKSHQQQQKQQPVTDRTPRITWRGNGEMFAINYWKDGRRTFKVYQENCEALFECCEDDVDGVLESVIAWRPEGNMIANSVRLEGDRYCICIFEKNGYKRFSFPLVYEKLEVKALKWSQRGDVLAVLQGDRYLSLYTTSNYKWYLKQHLVFQEDVVSFCWSTLCNDLQVFTRSDFFTYELQMAYDVSDDCVAVIDGKNVHLTRFRDSCLPPPLPQKTIVSQHDAAVNFVVFLPDDKFATVDCDWHVTIYGSNFEILSSYQIPVRSMCGAVFHNFHSYNDALYCLAVQRLGEIQLVLLTDEGAAIPEIENCAVDLKKVRNIQNLLDLKARLYQMENEVVVVVAAAEEANTVKHTIVLTKKCLIVKSVYCTIEDESYVFSLTATNDFYVNDKCVLKAITSFIVLFNRYLLLTTATSNLLFCIRLLPNHIEKLHELSEADFFHRPTEQGARLICGVNNTSTVILQIPRGNLEIISCRPIAIDILEHYLCLNNWQEALHFLRTDRLNFNLLIDLNPDRFVKNIDKFVEACKTPAVLNTFIQEIEDCNVLETIYSQCYQQQSRSATTNKRTLICNALLSYFQENDYAVSTITLALHHFNAETAFGYIQDLYHRLPETQAALTNAVKTLLIHTRTEADDYLFKNSLHLYDTNFTRHICGFTQMDPKFYLPFLNELDGYSEVKRRYEINVFLKRPKLAVQYLIRDASVDFDVVLQFVQRHREVLPTVYSYYDRESPIFQRISKLYSDFLSEKKMYAEAAAVCSLAGLWLETFEQYKLANDWLAAITILNTKLLEVIKDKHEMIAEIADDLIRARRYKEAATIQEQHLNNYEEAIKTLLCGCHFRDALFLTVKYQRQDVVLHDVIPTIERYCLDLAGKIQDTRRNFHQYKDRLFNLRTTKLQKYNNKNVFLADEDHPDNTDFDLYSDAGSVITKSTKSTSSRSSTRSSKNRRKEERKKQDLREGGVYEDIALIRALYGLIEETFKMGTDVRELCLVLLELNMREEGKYLHELLKETQREMKDNVKDIWLDLSSMHNQDRDVLNENFDLLDEKYKNPPCVDNATWQLCLFTDDKTNSVR